jgi:hypothetical protein
VAVLADVGARDAVHGIARRYAEETGRAAHVFEGSSPGAARIGAIRLDPADDGHRGRAVANNGRSPTGSQD